MCMYEDTNAASACSLCACGTCRWAPSSASSWASTASPRSRAASASWSKLGGGGAQGLTDVTGRPADRPTDRYIVIARYLDHQCALDAVAFLHGTTLDERIVRVELDWGYHPSRRYGRGESGGQVRSFWWSGMSRACMRPSAHPTPTHPSIYLLFVTPYQTNSRSATRREPTLTPAGAATGALPCTSPCQSPRRRRPKQRTQVRVV